MSYLLRATFVIPYQPHVVACDLIKNLVVSNRFQRLVTGPNLVSVQTSVDTEEIGEAMMMRFGTGLSQIVDADLKAKVYLTPIGERRKVEFEISRRKKADKALAPVPAQSGTGWRVSFSAVMKPSGALGEFSLVHNGERVLVEKNVALETARNAHEAVYDCLECALIHIRARATVEECSKSFLALVSPSQLIIKQLRGEWKIESDSLIVRGEKIQKLLGEYDRSKLSFHLPRELNVPAGAVA